MKRIGVVLVGLVLAMTAMGASGDLRLIETVKAQNLQAVTTLIKQRIGLDAAEADGSTALHWAAQLNREDLVKLLVEAGANPNAKTRYGIAPLTLACTNGSAAIVELLLAHKADPTVANNEGATALMTCARTGNVDAMRPLIVRGANVNAVEGFRGQTALMWAASENNAEAVTMLAEAGADVNAESKSGFTAFLFAARGGGIDAARALLASGANVNDQAPDGTNALGMSVLNAQYATTLFLLEKGADPNAPDPRGSVLHSLAWMRKPGASPSAGAGGSPQGPPPSLDNVDTLDVARALLKHGADPNRRVAWKEQRYNRDFGQQKLPPDIPIGRKNMSYVGATPFYVAAQNGDYQYMKVLADGGADPRMPTLQNITPLMAAAGLGYWDGESPGPHAGPVPEEERLEAVKLALALGNDINARADFGDFPINEDGEYLLLYYPKNLDEITDQVPSDVRWTMSTALHGAVVSGQLSIVKYLVEHGAQIDAKNRLGWTPVMVADGVFVTNTKKEFPDIGVYLRRVMKDRGMPVPAAGTNASEVVRARAANFDRDPAPARGATQP
jgi:ankyrin repeat protein